MIRENRMKTGLKQGKNFVGTFAKMRDPSVVEIFALSGFDYFIIDNEHSQMSKETMVDLLRAADISGIIPVVRVRENSRAQILQGLDAGGLGVMVPETETAEEVQHVVDSALYAPEGKRGYTNSGRAAGYGHMDAAEYARVSNDNVMVIVYCETLEGISNLSQMVAVPHVDVLWIGPMDLSQAFGVTGNPKHPKVVSAMDSIIATCRNAGVAVGTVAPDIDTANDLFQRGVQLISLSSDQAMISFAARTLLSGLKT